MVGFAGFVEPSKSASLSGLNNKTAPCIIEIMGAKYDRKHWIMRQEERSPKSFIKRIFKINSPIFLGGFFLLVYIANRKYTETVSSELVFRVFWHNVFEFSAAFHAIIHFSVSVLLGLGKKDITWGKFLYVKEAVLLTPFMDVSPRTTCWLSWDHCMLSHSNGCSMSVGFSCIC